MEVRYDPEADAIDVKLRDWRGPLKSRPLDDRRIVDFDEEGNVVGVEFLFVSEGIHLEGVPEADRVRKLLQSLSKLTPVG